MMDPVGDLYGGLFVSFSMDEVFVYSSNCYTFMQCYVTKQNRK